MHRSMFVCLTTLTAAAACVGDLGDPPSPKPSSTITCDLPRPGPAPLTRLNSREYRSSMLALFGVSDDWGLPEDDTPKGHGFDNSVRNASLSQLRVEALFRAADAAGKALVQQLDSQLPCEQSAVDPTCIDALIRRLGRLVYRRPLDDDEIASLHAVYTSARLRGEPLQLGVELMVKAMAMAPQFIYKPEYKKEQAQEVAPDVFPLNDHAIATRLAFLFWGSTPDAALIDAADHGLLANREGVKTQAQRLLADPRARHGVVDFLMQWIGVKHLSSLSRNSDIYSSYTPELAHAMEEELRRFLEHVVFEQNGSVSDLLKAEETVVNASLAEHYGIEHPTGEGWAAVSLPHDERRGFLNLAGFLTSKAHSIQPAPVQRGLFVRTRLLCDPIPDPPDDVDISLPAGDPSNPRTNRELLAEHASNPQCRGCHEKMDPIGFAFENFDSIGKIRTQDNGFAIDTSGELVDAGDATGSFTGSIELIDRLAASEKVKNCMRIQAFRYATGRDVEVQDKCSLQQTTSTAAPSGGSIRDILVGIATSDAFRFRHEGE